MRLTHMTAVVWDPSRDAVLARSTNPGLRLPVVSVDDSGFGESLPQAIQYMLGLETVLLEPLGYTEFLVEVRGGMRTAIPELVWLDVQDAARLGDDAWMVTSWLATRASPLRPWFEPGWLDRAVSFIGEALTDLRRIQVAPVQQLKHWAISSVLRIPTSDGPLYFKASPPAIAVEPRMLAALGDRHPQIVPRMLRWSPTENWWITDDFGSVDGWAMPESGRLEAVTLLADLQIDVAASPGLIGAVGCDTCTVSDLAASVPMLLARDDIWCAPHPSSSRWRALSDEQRNTWLALGPWLVERCNVLAEASFRSGIDVSLTHGDFHPGNVAQGPSAPLLHDWSRAQISHPFFDLAAWLKNVDDTRARSHVRTYLSRFERAGHPGNLMELWRIAKPVSALHEVRRALIEVDDFGPAHRFTMIAVAYGWVRRLLGAYLDPEGVIPNWPTTGLAAKP